MDLGLFIFLGIFAYSSLFVRAKTDQSFVVLPILGLGVVCAAILGTYSVANDGILIQTIVTTNSTSISSSGNVTSVYPIVSSMNATSIEFHPILNINEEWAIVLFSMFHFLLAFLNVVSALYFIGDKTKTKSQFQ